MDLTQLANLGEFIGGVAVLVTLIYLVVQVRQNTHQLEQATEVARGTSEVETAKMNMSYFAEFVRDPALMLIWERAFTEPETLTPEDRVRWSCSMALWFHVAQGNYRQYRRGLLPSESWEPIERGLAGVLQQEAGWEWWMKDALNVAVLATDFRAHAEGLAKSYSDDVWVPPRVSEVGKH